MTDKFRIFRRASKICYIEDRETGYQQSLCTRDPEQASTGKGDRNWAYYYTGTQATVPKMTVPIVGMEMGGWKVGPNIGHGLRGHTVDWTWRDDKKAMKMAEEVFKQLQ